MVQQKLQISTEKGKNPNPNQYELIQPQIRFPNFNDSWTKTKLNNECEIIMGQSPSSKNYTGNPKDTILIQGNADLENGKVKPRIYTVEVTKKSIKNDIILTVRAPVGDLAINEYVACIGRGVCAIRSDKNKFLYYFLENAKQNHIWEKLSQGSTFESINSNDIKNIGLYIPSKIEQDKIVNFLTTIDKKIELLEKKHTDLLNFKKGFLKKIFIDNKSDSWKNYKISDLGVFKSGYAFKEKYQGHLEYDIPFFKVSDLNLNLKYMEKSQNTVNEEMCAEMKCKILDKPSIIIAKLGEAIYLERKRITVNPCIIDNNLLAFQPNENFDLEFVYYMLFNYHLSRYAQQTAVPSLSPKDIGDIKCVVPESIDEQKRISKIFLKLDDKIELMNKEFLALNEFKKGLLQKMFV